MKNIFVTLNRTDSDWGADIVEFRVKEGMTDRCVEDAIEDAIVRVKEDEEFLEAETSELNDEILNRAAKTLGCTWSYVSQVCIEYNML